jgi:predicted O-linked N-acetylglucosamine transferase (SPINDLY family)
MNNQRIITKALEDARSGHIEQAIASLRLYMRINRGQQDVISLLGMLLVQNGQAEQAVHHLAQAAASEPNSASAHNNLANALHSLQRNTEAAKHFERALAIDPNHRHALLGLTTVRIAMNDAEGAIAIADRGLMLNPHWPQMEMNRSAALASADRIDEAIASMMRVLTERPNDQALRGTMLYALNSTSQPAADIFAEHRKYALGVAAPTAAVITDEDPDRPLRIGVLSGDLRTHSVGYFAEAFMRNMPAGWTLVAFSTTADRGNDAMTMRFRAMCNSWVDASPLNDAALDAAIREHRIDVLVELSGHTSGGRLTALDRKPAPVIVSAIGYPNTTGHPCIDWRIVDSVTDPAGAEALCTERLARIDPCFLCYTPPANAPIPEMPPAEQPVTFGSFNLTSKIRDETIAVWARVLAAVPGSRLLLKSKSIADPTTLGRLQARMQAGGVDPSRIDSIAYTKTVDEHLRLYARVHVALDTMPYNGTTTTCEALWMGVPVVCVEGDRHAARVGASLLRATGCEHLLGSTTDEFVDIAVKLAHDRAQLTALRSELRARLLASPLMDSRGYAERFHSALRECYRAQHALTFPSR